MRGTPGGKHPTEFNVVGLTGSLESSNERGPNDGLVALNLSCAQGVIGGSVALKVHDQYRVWGEPRKFQTPDRSGVLAAPCAHNTGAPQTAAAAMIRSFDQLRMFAFLPDSGLVVRSRLEHFAVHYGFGDPQRVGAAFRAPTGNRHFVTGLQGVRVPPGANQMVGAGQLALPLLQLAFIVFHVERYDAMRVQEHEVRNRARYGDRFLVVVARLAMVGES